MSETIIDEDVVLPQPLTVNDLFPSSCPLASPEGHYYDEGVAYKQYSEDYLEECRQRSAAKGKVLAEKYRRECEEKAAAEYEGIPLDKSSKKREKVITAYKVSTIRAYQRDIKIQKQTLRSEVKRQRKGKVGRKIVAFSKASRRNMKFKLRNVDLGKKPFILTLTYPNTFPSSGREVKAHWELMRKWLIYRKLAGFWFLEFQRRGAPHIHVLLTGYIDDSLVKKHWIKIIKASAEDVEKIMSYSRNGAHVEIVRNAERCQLSYACKYAAKMEQKNVPEQFLDVGRFWGFFGGLKLVEILEWSATEQELAYYLRIIKGMETGNRRRWGGIKRRYPGKVGWTSFGVSQAFVSNWK
jgi:hypothetical protein